jgi:hypothetical protein
MAGNIDDTQRPVNCGYVRRSGRIFALQMNILQRKTMQTTFGFPERDHRGCLFPRAPRGAAVNNRLSDRNAGPTASLKAASTMLIIRALRRTLAGKVFRHPQFCKAPG